MNHLHKDRDILWKAHRDIEDILQQQELPGYRKLDMIRFVVTAADCERRNLLRAERGPGHE